MLHARQTLPQNRADHVTDQPIRHPAGDLGFNQPPVNLPGGGQRRPQVRFGDGGEGDAAQLARRCPAQLVGHVLGNRLAFPIQVGRQVNHLSRGRRLTQGFEFFAFTANEVKGGGKILQVDVQTVNRHF